ncbi:hypothetical protein [Nonomuraea sp. KM88]|uniref:hypothetical protein n=1 Tax=Nonomuraea sp. KM88 TaxID=3457427 RepID=UPI003FCE8E11
MTEPITSATTASTSHSCGALTVRREVHDPTGGHLPLTVWLAAADTESASTCESGCCHPVSGRPARHRIATCTRMGETITHLGATDHQVISAALTAGRLPVAVFTDANWAGVTSPKHAPRAWCICSTSSPYAGPHRASTSTLTSPIVAWPLRTSCRSAPDCLRAHVRSDVLLFTRPKTSEFIRTETGACGATQRAKRVGDGSADGSERS